MSTRVRLGASGLEVSPVCFGTWQLSPRFWLDQSKADVLAAMRRAVELGINFFDTADAYGDGYAETVLGEFLNGQRRDELIVCTKVFNHFNPDASRYPDLSPAHIRERCELELKRLGTDYIDLYLLHFYDHLTPLADVAETLEGLRRAGKVRHYGMSNFNVEQMRAIRRFGRFTVLQPPYSLVRTDIETDVLPYCQGEDIGVMVFSPMHMGLLSGKYTGTESFTDFRQHHVDFSGERFARIAAGVRSLAPLAAKYELSIYQLVLAATLMHPAIQCAVVGIKNAAQITEAAGAMGKTISRPDYYAIRKALTFESTRVTDATGKKK